jgi:hypothetical protein
MMRVLNILPVQYDKDQHIIRIWQRMVFNVLTSYNPGSGTIDTDGDLLPDYWELAYGLEANDSTGEYGYNGDPDTDGLGNIEEFNHGTDPFNPDTDGDGFSDSAEVWGGTDPLNPASPMLLFLPIIQKNN